MKGKILTADEFEKVMNDPMPLVMARHLASEHGVRIIPIPAREKGCTLSGWPDLATTDRAQIDAWFDAEPNSNYGCVCTPETICVLDADNPGLRAQIERSTGREFPDTTTVKTSHGYHYYFLQTQKTREMGNRKVATMFDLQSDRKYVVGPGCIHPSGVEYIFLNMAAPVPMPDWLADYLGEWSNKVSSRTARTDAGEVHEDFDFDDFREFFELAGHEEKDSWFICDECPIAGYRHSQSTKTGFYFDGSHLGFHCFASGCEGSEMSVGRVIAFLNKKKGEPYRKPIWAKSDDDDLDGVEMLDDHDVSESDGTSVAQGPESEGAEAEAAPKTAENAGLYYLATEDIGEDFSRSLLVQRADSIVMTELQWLWPQRIPAGKMTFYTGKPDCGKSLSALDLAARVSSGSDWPDGQPNTVGGCQVLIAASEDDASDTLVPRLVAAGANLHNIHIVHGTMTRSNKDGKKKKKRSNLDLKRDAQNLLNALRSNPEFKLLILDPITSFLGDADTNKDKDIRPIMDAITRLCNKSGITIVGLIHSNKRSDVDAVHKVSGAGALAASVRAVWGFSRDTEDRTLYHMAFVKGNLGKDKTGLNYSIEEAFVDICGKQVGVPRITWGDKFEGDADDLLAAGREQKDRSDFKSSLAKAYLRTAVRYPIKAKDLYEQGQLAEGLSVDSLKKAKNKLWEDGFHIVVRKRDGCWWWYHEEDGKLIRDTSKTMEQVENLDGVI